MNQKLSEAIILLRQPGVNIYQDIPSTSKAPCIRSTLIFLSFVFLIVIVLLAVCHHWTPFRLTLQCAEAPIMAVPLHSPKAKHLKKSILEKSFIKW